MNWIFLINYFVHYDPDYHWYSDRCVICYQRIKSFLSLFHSDILLDQTFRSYRTVLNNSLFWLKFMNYLNILKICLKTYLNQPLLEFPFFFSYEFPEMDFQITGRDFHSVFRVTSLHTLHQKKIQNQISLIVFKNKLRL